MSEKAALRRAVRAAFPGGNERDRQSALLCARVMDWDVYRKAQVVGGYLPLKREPDITPILRHALESGKLLALPRVDGEGMMTFHRINSLDELTPGAYGIPEPAPDSPIVNASRIELLLTPLEAIDSSGMRLGKGGGYYDRILPRLGGMAAGMVMQWQWVEHVPCETWDRPLHAAADCEGIRLFEEKRPIDMIAYERKDETNDAKGSR